MGNHFLASTQRSSGCDDVDCWCLTKHRLLQEFAIGKVEYNFVWAAFATKLDALSEEFGMNAQPKEDFKEGSGRRSSYVDLARSHLSLLDSQTSWNKSQTAWNKSQTAWTNSSQTPWTKSKTSWTKLPEITQV